MDAHIMTLDPDYRRQPKTDFFCCLCQRDIKGAAAGWLHFVGDQADEVTDSEVATMGRFPVGPECARKVRKTLGERFLHQTGEAA